MTTSPESGGQPPQTSPPNKPPQGPQTPAPQNAPGPFDANTFFWMALVFIAYYLFFSFSQPSRESINYSEFKQALVQDRVAEVTFRGDQILGSFRDGNTDTARFVTVQPAMGDDQLLTQLEQRDVIISAESAEQPVWVQLLLGILPW